MTADSKYKEKEQSGVMGNIFNYIKQNLVVIIFVLIFVGFPLWGILKSIDDNAKRDYLLNDLKVSRATIAETNCDSEGVSNKYYVRVKVPDINANPDDLWVEVTNDFYSKHYMSEQIGILIGNYDIYKVTNDLKKKYEKTAWGIEEIYDTYDAANQANPYKKFNLTTVIKDKKNSKSGKMYFTLDAKGKTFKTPITKEVFDKYEVGQEIEGEFESLGEYVKFLQLKEENL